MEEYVAHFVCDLLWHVDHGVEYRDLKDFCQILIRQKLPTWNDHWVTD